VRVIRYDRQREPDPSIANILRRFAEWTLHDANVHSATFLEASIVSVWERIRIQALPWPDAIWPRMKQ
jgi:hypothetical protein